MCRFRYLVAFGILASLTACQTQATPSRLQAKPTGKVTSQLIARRQNRPHPLWAFTVSQAGCHARLTDGDITVLVDTSPARPVSVSIATVHRSASAGRAVSVAFAGSRSWKIHAQDNGFMVEASLPDGPEGMDDLITLLAGGRLSLFNGDGAFYERNVSDAGVAGRDWYGCVVGTGGDRPV